jgi:hypothetical protein
VLAGPVLILLLQAAGLRPCCRAGIGLPLSKLLAAPARYVGLWVRLRTDPALPAARPPRMSTGALRQALRC